MKKTLLALFIFVGAGVEALAEPATFAAPTEAFFIKMGAGSYFSQFFFTHYNRPDTGPYRSLVTETIGGVSGFTGSAAVGIDCPDHFSYFASGEWLTKDGSFMVNAQYTIPDFNPINPYLSIGLGLDFSTNNSVGGCAQLGMGTNFVLSRSFGFFVETKLVVSNVYWTSPENPQKDFVQWAGYIPVLAGIKLSL